MREHFQQQIDEGQSILYFMTEDQDGNDVKLTVYKECIKNLDILEETYEFVRMAGKATPVLKRKET